MMAGTDRGIAGISVHDVAEDDDDEDDEDDDVAPRALRPCQNSRCVNIMVVLKDNLSC